MFKNNSLVIKHESEPIETFALDKGVPFGSYKHDGTEKMSLNCWVDFVDFDDSEIVGGSEVYALIWGLRITESAFRKKGAVVESTAVSFERDEDADLSAVFFAGEFHQVAELHLETTGQGRFRVYLRVEDITGESDEMNTEVWVAGKLEDKPCEMSYPE